MLRIFLFTFILTIALNLSEQCSSSSSGSNGMVTVYNYGAFTARFILNYYLAGYERNEITEAFTQNQNKKLEIPSSATNIKLAIQSLVFIGSYKDIRFQELLPSDVKCFKLTGTVFSPAVSEC